MGSGKTSSSYFCFLQTSGIHLVRGWQDLLLHTLKVGHGGCTGLLLLENGPEYTVVEKVGIPVRGQMVSASKHRIWCSMAGTLLVSWSWWWLGDSVHAHL